ncbi:MAG: hypothetical protein H0Z28_06525 [Archaeoglobus sp.]|nr:hypothetical protein [Archaeoglobus sp.]
MSCMNLKDLDLKKALKDIFDDEFREKARKLKEIGPFDPLSLIIFTRAAEFSAIKNDLVIPSKLDLQKMFDTRDGFSCAILNTLKDIIFNQYISEIRQGKGPLLECIEDLVYVLNRIEEIQFRIDNVILNLRDEILWKKNEILEVYIKLINLLLEWCLIPNLFQ